MPSLRSNKTVTTNILFETNNNTCDKIEKENCEIVQVNHSEHPLMAWWTRSRATAHSSKVEKWFHFHLNRDSILFLLLSSCWYRLKNEWTSTTNAESGRMSEEAANIFSYITLDILSTCVSHVAFVVILQCWVSNETVLFDILSSQVSTLEEIKLNPLPFKIRFIFNSICISAEIFSILKLRERKSWLWNFQSKQNEIWKIWE